MGHPVIGIVANPTKQDAAHHVRHLQQAFAEAGATVLLEEATACFVQSNHGLPLTELAAGSDVLVVRGGDVTILRTARLRDRLMDL